jgi:hypothetical protein
MIPDYSEALLTIQAMRKKAQDALLRHDWKTACDCADEIFVAARGMKMYALDQLEKKTNADKR